MRNRCARCFICSCLRRSLFWGRADSRWIAGSNAGPERRFRPHGNEYFKWEHQMAERGPKREVVMKRRDFLKGAGVVTVLVAAGKVWRAYGQATPEVGAGPAFEPWRDWEKEAQEGPLALVHAAILSSNAFNTQPWLFKVSSSRIEVYADTKRNLGAFDPYLREMFFSLGCALENLCLTAPAHGLTASVSFPPGKLELIPEQSKPQLAAAVNLRAGPRNSAELFDAIPHRHTNREPFDTKREVPAEFVSSLASQSRSEEDVRSFLFTQESDRKQIVDVIWDTSKKLISDPAVRAGMQTWYRATMQQVQDDRDGTYVGPPVEKPAGPPLSYPDLMMTGRLFGIIAVRDRYDRPQLFATARDLAARPANGAVEFVDQERKRKMQPETLARLAKITGDASWQ